MVIIKIACILSALSLVLAEDSLYISAFNVQVFGKSKMSKPEVVDKLVEIILRYDMTIIQEIRDIDMVAFPQLLDEVNAVAGGQYDGFMSEREGRTSSKEQYGFIFNKAFLNPTSRFSFPDDEIYGDVFERAPYIVTFQNLREGAAQSVFNTIVLHAKPDDAVSEVSALADVYDYAVTKTNIMDAVILGDLNADCSYIRDDEWQYVKLCTEQRFNWKIPNSADTTVSTTNCAYDRIVTAGDMTNNVYDSAVFNFESYYGLSYEEAKDVSDHYPVEFRLH